MRTCSGRLNFKHKVRPISGGGRSNIEYLIKSKIPSLVSLVGSRGFQFQTSYPFTAYLIFKMATADIDYWTVFHIRRFLKHTITSLSYIPYAPLALFWHRIVLCTSGILMRNNNNKSSTTVILFNLDEISRD